MAASKVAPLVRVAVGTTAACVDLMLLRVALAASRGKRRRLRELNGRLRYYEEMAERYAQIDPAHFYAKPEAIRPLRERPVRRLPGGAVVDLAWWSGYEPRLRSARDGFLGWRNNHTAYIRLFRHQQPAHAALIWIHGYRSGSFAIEERVSPAFDLYKRGFDVALYTVPFHGLRAPRPFLRAPLFPSQGNIARTNEGFGQVVWELRGLL